MKKVILSLVFLITLTGCHHLQKEMSSLISTGIENGITSLTGIDKRGFNTSGIHIKTKTKYDQYGYNVEGYTEHGFNMNGIHKDTKTKYDPKGFNFYGKTKDGYDRNGYNKEGWDRNGYNKEGLNKLGFDKKNWHSKLEVYSNGKTKSGKKYEVNYKIKAGSGLDDIDNSTAAMVFLMSGGNFNMNNSPIYNNGNGMWVIEELYINGNRIQSYRDGFFRVKLPIGETKSVRYVITTKNNYTGQVQQYYKNGILGYETINELLRLSPSATKQEALYLLPI